MQTHKISSNINFQGIYRIPNTPRNAIALKTHVLPAYYKLRHEQIFAFPGNNPFKLTLDIVLNMVAEANNSSSDWVRMNATNHGANFSDVGDNVIHVISSDKDILRFKKYLKTRTSKDRILLRRLNKFFKARKSQDIFAQIPEHLKVVFATLRRNKAEDIAFAQFAHDAIEVDTPQELLAFLLTEK